MRQCRSVQGLLPAGLLGVLALLSVARGQGEGSVIPAAEGRPALAFPPGVARGDLALPEWLGPGIRITWHGGESVLAGVRSKLVMAQGKQGYWTDPLTGKTYNDESTRSSGGVGFHQANIVAASAAFVAVDGRNYPISDVDRNIASSGGAVAMTGNAVSTGVYWIHPRLLDGISAVGATPQSAGILLVRGPYTMLGYEFNAVTITSETSTGFSRTVYDLETGLLIFRGTATAGEAVSTINQHGQVSPGGGGTVISHFSFLATRRLDIPWRDNPAPAWATKGQQLRYRGSAAAITSMGALPGQGFSSTIILGDTVGGVVSGRIVNVFELGPNLPPQEGSEERVFASAMFCPLWIAPAAMAKLQAGQLLDEDPVTRFRTSFEGVEGAIASVLEQGPAEANQYFYDRNSGALTGMRTTKQTPTGQMRTEFSAVR